MKNILVAGPFSKEEMGELSGLANLYRLGETSPSEFDALLPSIDCLFVHLWPKELDSEKLRKMERLSFVQTVLAGVNHIPFKELSPDVVVSSNAGGYSDEVGEFAWALLLAAAKRVVMSHVGSEKSGFGVAPLELGKKVTVLKGKVLGVLGYGGIGRSVARIGLAFGMRTLVLSRRKVAQDGIESLSGENGLKTLLSDSDVVVIALPLNKSTKKMMGGEELSMMKRDGILVNVARGEIVDQKALHDHLLKHSGFVYATDVWWSKDGKECYPPELPFFELENFIGTPHIAGPSAVKGGGPLANTLSNLLRYARGEKVLNVVDRTDYV